ncbi:MAG: ABC transporter permease, partial [Nanoarchaeota archaeon]
EFLISGSILGIIRVAIVSVVMAFFAFILYSFNIFTLGFSLIPFLALLLLFGWTLGFFSIAIILRYGTSAQVLAWGFLALIQPFSAVFYPVSALPIKIQYLAYLLPTTHIFEGMRAVISTGFIPWSALGWALLLNVVYLALVMIYFNIMFAWVKKKGLLAKLDF